MEDMIVDSEQETPFDSAATTNGAASKEVLDFAGDKMEESSAKYSPPRTRRTRRSVMEESTRNSCSQVGKPMVPEHPPRLPEPSESTYSLKVYVRLKPSPGVKLPKNEESLYEVVSPAITINLRNVEQDMTKNVDVVGKKFTFSETFGGDVSQSTLFQRTVEPLLGQFFHGTNCTLMAYGTTGSGKSHTLYGTYSDPGLIPMTAERVFTMKKPTVTPNYRPKNNSVESLTLDESLLEVETRKSLAPLQSNLEGAGNTTCEFAELPETAVHHEVWVSFGEIQDENYYDLLSPDYQTSHLTLKADTDDDDTAFIKNLTHISVGAFSDVCNVLEVGRNNFIQWNSKCKTSTSKSHCIFSIILLTYRELSNPQSVQINRFSFCDLAAQESPDLDTSLLALLQCLSLVKELHNPDAHAKPTECFCSSALTQLFEKALTEREPLSLLVNIDPYPAMYKETQSIMYSTAISSEIVTKIRNTCAVKVTSNFGKIAVAPVASDNWDDLTADKLMELHADFQTEMTSLRALNLRGDVQIRRTMVQRYASMISRIDQSYKRRLNLAPVLGKNIAKKSNGEDPDLTAMQRQMGEEMDALKGILDTLRTHKQLFERDLTVSETELNEIPAELRETYNELMDGQDPHLRLVDAAMELKNERYRGDILNGLLNEARSELIRILNESYEDKKKLAEIEKRYVALKFEWENELTLRRSRNHSFKNQLQMTGDIKNRWEREMEMRAEYQKKCEALEKENELLKKFGGEAEVDRKENVMELDQTDDTLYLNYSEDSVPTGNIDETEAPASSFVSDFGTETLNQSLDEPSKCETELESSDTLDVSIHEPQLVRPDNVLTTAFDELASVLKNPVPSLLERSMNHSTTGTSTPNGIQGEMPEPEALMVDSESRMISKHQGVEQREVLEPGQTGVLQLQQTEVLESEQTEVPESEETEVPEPEQTEVLEPEQTEVFEPMQTEVLEPEQTENGRPEPDQIEVLESKQTDVLEPEETEAPESEQIDVLEPEETEAPESEQIDVLEPEQTEAPESEQIDVLEPEETEVLEPEQIEASESETTNSLLTPDEGSQPIDMNSDSVNSSDFQDCLDGKKEEIDRANELIEFRKQLHTPNSPAPSDTLTGSSYASEDSRGSEGFPKLSDDNASTEISGGGRADKNAAQPVRRSTRRKRPTVAFRSPSSKRVRLERKSTNLQNDNCEADC